MNARRLILAAVVSLSTFTAGALLVAPAALAEEVCPNAASRQGPSVSLPDCRAYEQVTPINKGDGEDLFPSGPPEGLSPSSFGYAAEDGNSFLLQTPSIVANGGQAYTSAYVFSRGADGWGTTPIAPSVGANLVEPTVFNADFSEVGFDFKQLNHVPGQPEEQVLAGLVGPLGGPYMTLSSSPFSEVGSGYWQRTGVVGASSDLGVVVLEGADHELAAGAGELDEGSAAVYEWSGGQARLVNVNSDGTLVSKCGAILGLGNLLNELSPPGGAHNAVSSDGSKIVFTAPDPNTYLHGPGCWNRYTTPQENPPELYMRLNGTSTVELSAPEPGVNDPTLYPAIYVGASADDSKVFFLTETEVTRDDKGHGRELYEYNTQAPEGERVVRISGGESGVVEGDVDFIPAVSADGSTVYFTAFGQLVPGLPALGPEEVYLYRYETSTKKTTYITRVESSDYPNTPDERAAGWYHGTGSQPGDTSEVAVDAEANWYTTANGDYLIFTARKPLTGYDNEVAPGGECKYINGDAQTYVEGRCGEVYRYSASDNGIVCVSCGAPGVLPIDHSEFARSAYLGPSNLPPRPVSENGSEVFFETTNALVPNTPAGRLHVYEWHNGTISLISSANDPGNAYFLGSSADGSNVFVGTHAQLVPQDTDLLSDVYDARADGGFVGITPSLCTGTGCQGVPAAPPLFATPASVTFEGVGNFPPGTAASAKPAANTTALTSRQKLSRSLRVCKRDRGKRKRAACEARARKRDGGAHKSKSNRRGK